MCSQHVLVAWVFIRYKHPQQVVMRSFGRTTSYRASESEVGGFQGHMVDFREGLGHHPKVGASGNRVRSLASIRIVFDQSHFELAEYGLGDGRQLKHVDRHPQSATFPSTSSRLMVHTSSRGRRLCGERGGAPKYRTLSTAGTLCVMHSVRWRLIGRIRITQPISSR